MSKYVWDKTGYHVEGIYREGEEIIAQFMGLSFNYALYEIKGRFRAGEKVIKYDKHLWADYVRFLKSKGIKI